jgi:predicted transposase YbfD/YdcC
MHRRRDSTTISLSTTLRHLHSNEITAIPALLELIDLSGAIVTIDAMGAQTEIVRQIRQKNADYVLALKANHPTLSSQVEQWFETALTTHFEGNVGLYQSILRKQLYTPHGN